MTDDVLIQRDGAVLAITWNRPDRFNALTPEMVYRAVDAIDAASLEASVRLITVTGAGRAFCAGADISGGADATGAAGDAGGAGQDELPGTDTLDAVNRFALSAQAAPQLVVALVNGVAAGVGSSIALGADLAFASSSAYVKTGFEAIGLIPDGGGTAYLTAALGRSRALAVAVLGDRITAEEALRIGLFARVWPAEEFAAAAAELVASLAAGPTRAYAAAKRTIGGRSLTDLAAAVEAERREQRVLLASADFAEGVAAFNEKRSATFQGR